MTPSPTLRIACCTALVVLCGCERVRGAIHELTRPADAGAVGDAGGQGDAGPRDAALADAGPPADAGSTDAGGGRDAGTPRSKSGLTVGGPVPSPKAKPPVLNGLPAGAPCVEVTSGSDGCASGSECTKGRCTCYNGWTACGPVCRDLSRDPYNCNACGRECSYGQRCVWGRCE